MAKPKDTAQQHLAEQREYVKQRQLDDQRKVAKTSTGSGLVDEKMLAESMRSVRYESEAHAAGDIIDNAIEAGAANVHIAYNVDGAAIREIGFIDDASGIYEGFLPHGTKWGGSSNMGRRNTFGRFGFGLPSASVNRGRKFQVLSRTDGDTQFAAVTVDLDNLVTRDQVVQLPKVEHRDLPDWVVQYVASERKDGKPAFPGGLDAVRTVVIWSELDRLKWGNRAQSSAKFREHLGITYAGWLDVVDLAVDGAAVEPVDVLFTTPGYRWYEIDGYPKADPHADIVFDVADANGDKHEIKVRFSYLSVPAYDATPPAEGRGRPPKIRARIRKDNNGIFITRNERFIEVARPAFLTWNNYARQVGIALDFPPALDELFGVTPDKQTITLSDRVEQLLEAHGVIRAFRALVAEVTEERRRRKVAGDPTVTDGPRPSEQTIAKVVELDVHRTKKTSDEAREEAEKNLRRTVKELAAQTGVPEEQIAEAREKLHEEKPYHVEFVKQTPSDPFYTPYMEGTQLILRINSGHPWYTELYGQLTETQGELRSGLELMLWVLAMSEVDATGDRKVFYRSARSEWSRQLADAFDLHPLIFNKVASKADLEDDDPEPWAEDADLEMDEEGADLAD